MQSVIETPSFLADAKEAGMDADEREAVVLFLSANPQAGDVMAGTGGARKFRFKRPGTGSQAAIASCPTMPAPRCRCSC